MSTHVVVTEGSLVCDGCFVKLPLAARRGEDYDSMFGTIWHMKPSCIKRVMERIPRPAA